MTISILKKLAVLPSGEYAEQLSFDELRVYLQRTLLTDAEKCRNDRHVLRDQLYRDGGREYMCSVVESVFQDEEVKRLRKAWVPYARFNNPVKRIVNEISTVYSESAERAIANDANGNFEALLKAVKFDVSMLEISRLVNLHRALLVGFRIRQHADGLREPVIDVATPASVRVIVSPTDNKLVLGWLIKTGYKAARSTAVPAWSLWTDHEQMFLRDDLSPIDTTYREHGLGVCPWVPITLGTDCPDFWPGEEGEDLVAAHVSIWMSNVLLLKEQKSATKLTVMSGDTSTMARGQASDSETVINAPDGTSVSQLDTSMDLTQFRDVSDHVLDDVGNNYGMAPAITRNQGVQSAEARDLLRIPLHEIRLRQQEWFRMFEQRFVPVMARILVIDLAAYAFDPTGFRIRFRASATPLPRADEFKLFVDERAAGVDDTVAYIMRQNPGMTEEEAMQEIAEHVAVETVRNVLMRPLQAISGSAGATTPQVIAAPAPPTVTPLEPAAYPNVSPVETTPS